MADNDILNIFTQRMDELINSHLILAEKSISQLLKCIAATPLFTEVITDTLSSVNYSDEFNNSRITYIKDGKNRIKFVLPAQKERIFTLVVCLLTEIDTGRRNLLDFLKEYYSDIDDTLSFKRFCDAILIPFKKAGENILKITAFDETNEIYQTENYFASLTAEISPKQTKNIIIQLDKFAEDLEKQKLIAAAQKQECYLISNALKNAVVTKNLTLAKLFWISFKNTVKANRVNSSYLPKIQKLLADAKIL